MTPADEATVESVYRAALRIVEDMYTFYGMPTQQRRFAEKFAHEYTAYESARGDVSAGVDEALDYLDSVGAGMAYDTYSTLHGLIGLLAPEPTVKPDRETVARALYDCEPHILFPGELSEAPEWVQELHGKYADAILALLPGRTEREVKAEALREAYEEWGDAPNSAKHDQYWWWEWLGDRATTLENGANDGR